MLKNSTLITIRKAIKQIYLKQTLFYKLVEICRIPINPKTEFYLIPNIIMSGKGLEPSQISPHEPESCASTNSATSTFRFSYILIQILQNIKC